MGQKIHPIAYRLGVTKQWNARWFMKDGYRKFLEEDELIRKTVHEKVGQAGIAAVEIERTSNALRVFIKAARPGLIIGRGGKGVEELVRALEEKIRKIRRTKTVGVKLDIEELKRSEISAPYVAQQIAWDFERRMPYRRTIKKYLDQILQNKEARGAKIVVSGRLDGAEISRRESLRKGPLPLTTLRADIDYGQATAFTTYGTVGVKIWIYKGEIFERKSQSATFVPNSGRGKRAS